MIPIGKVEQCDVQQFWHSLWHFAVLYSSPFRIYPCFRELSTSLLIYRYPERVRGCDMQQDIESDICSMSYLCPISSFGWTSRIRSIQFLVVRCAINHGLWVFVAHCTPHFCLRYLEGEQLSRGTRKFTLHVWNKREIDTVTCRGRKHLKYVLFTATRYSAQLITRATSNAIETCLM